MPEPVDPLPELSAELVGIGAIHDRGGTILHQGEFIVAQTHVERYDRCASRPEYFRRIRWVETHGVEIEVRRTLDERVILAGRKRDEVSA